MDSVKECSETKPFKKLCMLLATEGGIPVNQIRRTILSELTPEDLLLQYQCTVACGNRDLLDRLFSYMKLFKDLPEFHEIVNDDSFPLELLEEFLLYLFQLSEEEESGYNTFFNNYIYYISQERLVTLISETDRLSHNMEFFMMVLPHLENRFIDTLLSKSASLHSVLIDLFLNSSQERVGEILSRNPIIYDYVILFLELDERSDDAHDFSVRYRKIIENAKQIHAILEQIQGLNDEQGAHGGYRERGERMTRIIKTIMSVEDVEQTIAVLDYKKAFRSVSEKEMVHQILTDSSIQEFLSLKS